MTRLVTWFQFCAAQFAQTCWPSVTFFGTRLAYTYLSTTVHLGLRCAQYEAVCLTLGLFSGSLLGMSSLIRVRSQLIFSIIVDMLERGVSLFNFHICPGTEAFHSNTLPMPLHALRSPNLPPSGDEFSPLWSGRFQWGEGGGSASGCTHYKSGCTQ
jgi:hypothetical protein